MEGLIAQGKKNLISRNFLRPGRETAGLQELILYGLKGLAAYAAHAKRFWAQTMLRLTPRFHEILDFLTLPSPTLDELLRGAC